MHATVAASDDLGYTIGTFTMIFPNGNGIVVTEHGKQQTTWKKINGEWKVIEDTGTSNAPLPVSSPSVIVLASDVKWMDASEFLDPGAKKAVLVGDPSKSEPFTLRPQMPKGLRVWNGLIMGLVEGVLLNANVADDELRMRDGELRKLQTA